MANIYLLINHSPSSAWLAASMRANQQLLAAHHVDLVPFDSDNADFVPANHAFWWASPGEPPSPALAEKLETVRSSLAGGHSVLFLGEDVQLDTQKNFFAFLRQHLSTDIHPVVPILVLGKPTVLMEYWWLLTPDKLAANLSDTYVAYASDMSPLVAHIQGEWGKERLRLIPYLHNTTSADRIGELLHSVFSSLNIDATPQVAEPLPTYGFINTASAFRLQSAFKVRDNDWPRLDNAATVTTLQEVERDWLPDPLSPLPCRRELLEKGREDQAKLEELVGLPPHSLDAPGWYGTLPGMDTSEPLRADRVQAFAGRLPSDARDVLLARFVNDHNLLTEDQKALAAALAVTAGTEFHSLEMARPRPTLTVLTMTLNHEKYIGACIESVLAQKTDFPIQHVVLDHYSEDGTPEIIRQYAREYASIMPVLLNDHHRTFDNVRELFTRCESEYAALCDGDDYFIDPHKLQKQVDFLKSHPRCSLCFHPVAVVFENSPNPGIFPPEAMLPRGIHEEYYLPDLLKGNFIQTNSVVYKWRFRDGLPDWFRSKLCPGDWYWHLLHAEQGKIGFLPEIMSAYRRHDKSLYKDSLVNRTRHRRNFGMAELETYHAVNEHFQNRYFPLLARLANGVFCDYLEIYIKEDDKHLLDLACDTYPDFGRHFLTQIMQTTQPPAEQEVSK